MPRRLTHHETYLYGLNYSNKDFTKEDSFGKNVFTNAFPVSLSLYMNSQDIDPYLIEATIKGGKLTTAAVPSSLDKLIGCDPKNAYWDFETAYDGYRPFASGTPNRSDVVVSDITTGNQTRALEIKLVTVPNSATADLERKEQSCEIVARPPSIEQLCFSIAASYGQGRRHDLGDMITDALGRPMDYNWRDETYMRRHLKQILDAALTIAKNGISYQTPFALTGMWRTKGQSPVFDDECFDTFFWTDMAFMQLFTNTTAAAIETGEERIGRPSRSVIWLVKCLFDYAAQNVVTFSNTHRDLAYGGQTDKAGSFAGQRTLKFMDFNAFYHPRIAASEYKNIVLPEGVAMLKPERRLDASIITATLIEGRD